VPEIPKLWRKQFFFGYKAIALKPITTLNAYARSVIANRNTAESTMTRTLHNEGLPAIPAVTVAKLAARSGLVTPDSLVNCDHSDFDGLVAFVCAVQTGKGRAVPIYANVGYSGKLPAHDEAPCSEAGLTQAVQPTGPDSLRTNHGRPRSHGLSSGLLAATRL
jgi:hypothetical protein